MAHHRLPFTTETFHGYFSRDLQPILTISSGDSVEYQIPDAAWNVKPPELVGQISTKMEKQNPELDKGHCLAGPIEIEGAEKGDTLEIRIDHLEVDDFGWTSSGGWDHEVHRRLGLVEGPSTEIIWRLDANNATGINQHAQVVKLAPFLGVMGMPQDVEGVQPTPPPRRTGGNLDCKELTARRSLFLPIEVAGGMFSTGDGHAAQGDGEVCVTAIECPMRKAVLTFILHKEMAISQPRIRTENSWITLGCDPDLDEAVFLALDEMISLMTPKYGTDRKQLLGLMSVVADVRVTQIVNGTKGAHVILRDDAIITPQ